MRKVAISPNVFADRYAYSFTGNIYRFESVRRFEIPIFVEHIVSRQKRLECLVQRPATFEQGSRVPERFPSAGVSIHITDEQRGRSDSAMQFIQHLQCLRHKP